MKVHSNNEQLEKLLLGQEAFLGSVKGILEEEHSHDAILNAVVLTSANARINRITDLDPTRIFHVHDIERLCVKYRLRFLDGRWFKGALPPQVFYELRRLEERSRQPLAGFKVLAPARRFKLCDCDADPLLFIRIGEREYYLVHQWGGSLSRWRSVLNWPFRTVRHLIASVFLLAVLLSVLMPNELIVADPQAAWWGAHRVLFLFWSTMVCASFTVFGWFAFFGRFSAEAWRSHHFN